MATPRQILNRTIARLIPPIGAIVAERDKLREQLKSVERHVSDSRDLAARSYIQFRGAGDEALRAGDAAGAVTAFQEAAGLASDSAEAWLNLGRALSASGDATRSGMAYSRYLSIELEAAAKARGLEQLLSGFASSPNYFAELDPKTFMPRYPGIFIASLPKSGTVYLQEKLCEGLNKPPLGTPSGGIFPNVSIPRLVIDRLNERGAVYVIHCRPCEFNITEVSHRLDRLVVHVRDPRQALLSWVHFLPQAMRNADPVMHYHYHLPDDYQHYTLEQQIDWQIDHHFADFVAFIEGWWDASQRPGMKTRFLFTRHEDLAENPRQFFLDLLDFYQIPATAFVFPEAPKLGLHNFRSGRTDEWRLAFTPAQIEKATAMIPRRLIERFDWARS